MSESDRLPGGVLLQPGGATRLRRARLHACRRCWSDRLDDEHVRHPAEPAAQQSGAVLSAADSPAPAAAAAASCDHHHRHHHHTRHGRSWHQPVQPDAVHTGAGNADPRHADGTGGSRLQQPAGSSRAGSSSLVLSASSSTADSGASARTAYPGPPRGQGVRLPTPGLRQTVRQVVPPEGTHAPTHWRETVRLRLGWLRLAILALGRAGPPSPLALRHQAVLVCGVPEGVYTLRPPGQAHQGAPARPARAPDALGSPGRTQTVRWRLRRRRRRWRLCTKKVRCLSDSIA